MLDAPRSQPPTPWTDMRAFRQTPLAVQALIISLWDRVGQLEKVADRSTTSSSTMSSAPAHPGARPSLPAYITPPAAGSPSRRPGPEPRGRCTHSMPTNSPDWTKRRVRLISSGEGVRSPEGWLCARMRDAAPARIPSLKDSR